MKDPLQGINWICSATSEVLLQLQQENKLDKAALYLIPVLLGDTTVERVIPEFNKGVVSGLKYFVWRIFVRHDAS